MIKIGDPLQLLTRLVIKQQKLLSAAYHITTSKFAKDKDIAVSDRDKVKIIDKKIQEEKLKKYEISSDIMSPPPEDEVMPNTRDLKKPIDMREIPRPHVPSLVSQKYTLKAEGIFKSLEGQPKDYKTFKEATQLYLDKEGVYHRGMVEFNEVALKYLQNYNCLKDLRAYKALLNTFPKGRMVSKTFVQAELHHYPKQQDCAITIIDTMERNGVLPDKDLAKTVIMIFGDKSYAFRKLQRTMYWMPKFRYANPYPIPHILTEDQVELAKLALKRMSFDVNTELTVWHTNEVNEIVGNKQKLSIESTLKNTGGQNNTDEPFINNELIDNYEKDALMTRPDNLRTKVEDTFIVSAQSPEQRELIKKLSTKKAVFVDGGYKVWLRGKQQTYFVLRAELDVTPYVVKENIEEVDDPDKDLFNWTTYFEEERPAWLTEKKSVHEQDNNLILAMCITGTSSRDSLVLWIRYLQKTNPNLEDIPVIFTLKTDTLDTSLVKFDGKKTTSGNS